MSERIVVNSLSELVQIVRAGIAPGIKVYMPNNTRDDNDTRDVVEVDIDKVEQLLVEMAGRAEDATREPQYSPAPNFRPGTVPSAADGHAVEPQPWPKPYDTVYPPGTLRSGYGFVLSPIDPGIGAPEDFNAPVPGRNPADGVEPVNFQTDVSPIFKRHAASRVAPGTFAGTIPDQHGVPIAKAKARPVEKNAPPTIPSVDQPVPLSRKRRGE